MTYTRREVVGFSISCAAKAISFGRVYEATAGVTRGRRPFTWQDAYDRAEIERAVMAPTGDQLAVEITRPDSSPGLYGGWARPVVKPRGTVWLFDKRLTYARPLPLGDAWAWAPSFSPDGRQLAVLTLSNGNIGIVVYNTTSHVVRPFLHINADPYANVGCDRSGICAGTTVPANWGWSSFAWADDHTIIFVDYGTSFEQFDFAVSDPERTHAPLWNSASNGQLSVREWGISGPTCGVKRALVKLDCNSGVVTRLYAGDVRGASVSPDGKWAVALAATKHLPIASVRTMAPPLDTLSSGEDPLVSLVLARVDITGRQPPAFVESFQSVGNVGPDRLPIWTRRGARFAVPSRSTYSAALSTGDDACWEIETETLRARRWTASSALDSELIAAMTVSVPADDVATFLRRRPKLPEARHTLLPVGQIPGGVWRYGDSNVLLWANATVQLMDKQGVYRVPGEFSDVSLEGTASDKAWLITGSGAKASLLAVQGLHCQIEEIVMDADSTVLSFVGSNGTVVAKRDSSECTALYAYHPSRRRTRSSKIFNSQFAAVATPPCREVSMQDASGKKLTGILQLPVSGSAKNRHPVIVWAYPGHFPSITDRYLRPNSATSLFFPLQYLLTRGFAVFWAPLPIDNGLGPNPMDAVAQRVEPWLDVLDAQAEVLPGEYGFFGHSNGGYIALALEALTTRFKAIVAESAFADLLESTLASSLETATLDCTAELIQASRFFYEDPTQPLQVGGPVSTSIYRFVRNSPLFHMDSAVTPLLIMAAEFDIDTRGLESVFSVLDARGVPVELAYYYGERHVISSPGNLKNTWNRTEAFFRKYLAFG